MAPQTNTTKPTFPSDDVIKNHPQQAINELQKILETITATDDDTNKLREKSIITLGSLYKDQQ